MPRPKTKPRKQKSKSSPAPPAPAPGLPDRPAPAPPAAREALVRPAPPPIHAIVLILATAWVANYLHFTQFGLHEDDWHFAGAALSSDLGGWLETVWFYISHPGRAQGRPLQWALNMLLPLAGRPFGSVAVLYPIAFAFLAASAVMMYLVLRRRFSDLTSTLAAILFVTSPLYTLRQFLNGQFSFGPAFLIVFGAMLLYLRGHRAPAYALASLALLAYESIFLLFAGVPLLCPGRTIERRRSRWLVHATYLVAVLGGYFCLRRLLFHEVRVSGLPGPAAMLRPILHDWVFYAAGSFTTYPYAAWRAFHLAPAEAWIWCVPFLAAFGWFAYHGRRILAARCRRWGAPLLAHLGRPLVTGLVFVALGYALSWFFDIFMAGRFPYTGRLTRVSVAGVFGSSLMFAGPLAGIVRLACSWWPRALAWTAAAALLAICFVSSFAAQRDYARDWRMQRSDFEQIVAVTPDVQRDSLILLRLPFAAPGLPERPAIGDDRGAFDRIVTFLFRGDEDNLPRLFIVMTGDWTGYLRRDPAGKMAWKEASFPGRWYAAAGPRPLGRFIVLEKLSSGSIVRRDQPIVVDGIDIVQHMSPAPPVRPLWRTLETTALARVLVPGW